MKKILTAIAVTTSILSTSVCAGWLDPENSAINEAKQVNKQQHQYAVSQPAPWFDWSLERDLVIKLYRARNMRVSTHTVWRSDMGMIEGDCPSIGYGIPYDTSLTNPLVSVDRANNGARGDSADYSLTSVSQPEPNGVFASTNTSATWVMCTGDHGDIMPIYVEAKVTTYPYSVSVDYDKNRVIRKGKKTFSIKMPKH